MKKMLRFVLAAVLLAVVLAVALFFVLGGETGGASKVGGSKASETEGTHVRSTRRATEAERAKAEEAEEAEDGSAAPEQDGETEPDEPSAPMTEEERRADEEEKLVDAFDNLTDTWQEAAADKVTMQAIDTFREQFKKVPKARREECLQRALNLVPDENVMLLAGILFDKTQDPEVLEAIYNDILNRDEDVKKPILEHIFKDKEHPCWADTAWILDVTGEEKKDEAP